MTSKFSFCFPWNVRPIFIFAPTRHEDTFAWKYSENLMRSIIPSHTSSFLFVTCVTSRWFIQSTVWIVTVVQLTVPKSFFIPSYCPVAQSNIPNSNKNKCLAGQFASEIFQRLVQLSQPRKLFGSANIYNPTRRKNSENKKYQKK